MFSYKVVVMKSHSKQASDMICYLMLSIFVSWIGSSWSQTTIIRDVVPDSYLILSSNQYDDEVHCLQDPRCSPTAGTSGNGEECGEAETLLTCAGPSSRLFDGDTGNDVPDDPEDNDLSQYYTWQQGLTPSPYIAMIFNQPLVELPNITMYFYHEGRLDAQPPFLSMCFSGSLDDTACINTDLPERPDRLNNGVLEWPVTLLTNATSVTYLRIDMQYENDDDGDHFIFLSEIRVAERLHVQTLIPTPSSTTTSSDIADETLANNGPTNMLSHSPMIVNDTGRTTTSDNDDDSVNVAVISGAVIGTLLLIIVIIVMVIMMMILCNRRRRESRRSYNIDDNNVTIKLSSHVSNTQQHISNTSGQSHDHTDTDTLSQLGAKVDPTSKLETVNALHIPNKVKSLDSLLQRHDVIGSDVIITPNPSYSVGPNSLDTGKDCEYQYDYVQTNDGLIECDKVVGSTTSGGVYDEITDHADNVNIDPNPSYSLAQDVRLEDNPSYDKLQL